MTQKQALAGLRVVDFSNARPGIQASQVLADFGAEVVHVESPSGNAMRAEAAWQFWGRGKKSIQLDLKNPADVEIARKLASDADVVIECFRPGTAAKLGIGYDDLADLNPGLVYASITGFGQHGPFAGLQGYEGIVQAKMGVMWALEGMARREGPCFSSAAFSSYPASQLALQGIFAALYEREKSGVGQHVSTSMLEGLTVHDTYNWFVRVLAKQYPDAFKPAPRATDGVPNSGIAFRLLVAQTKDGRWLQFSQTVDRLFHAMMDMFGLKWMFEDPKWKTAPDFEDIETRAEFWEILLNIVRTKTAAEWMVEFDRDPNVWGEQFRKGTELLDHPQMLWNRMTNEVNHPRLGKIRLLGPLVRMDATPADVSRIAPELGEHTAELRAAAEKVVLQSGSAGGYASVAGSLPLAGVTVVELGTYYAAPYGASLLADLGARVIKLEQPDGDPQRMMLPFPEVAGMKALLGKECIAVDLQSEKGREIAHRIIKDADIVLQSFRAGVAKRLKLDPDTLRALNPNLIYHTAPGYGEDGPCGHRPAFAPTIGAAAGLAWRNAGPLIPQEPIDDIMEIRNTALQLSTAVLGVGNSDGISAVTVGTALLLGLLARERGAGGQDMFTSMISSTGHCLSEAMVEYEGCPPPPTADLGLYGFNALYRLYPCAEEWVFLAAPYPGEWDRLTATLPGGNTLASDPRFATPADRTANDVALAEALGAIFSTQSAQHWEALLRNVDVACVMAAHGPVDANYMEEGSVGQISEMMTMGFHAILGETPRLKPLVRFSRSSTTAGDAALVGQHTEQVMLDHGYAPAEIEALAGEGVVALG